MSDSNTPYTLGDYLKEARESTLKYGYHEDDTAPFFGPATCALVECLYLLELFENDDRGWGEIAMAAETRLYRSDLRLELARLAKDERLPPRMRLMATELMERPTLQHICEGAAAKLRLMPVRVQAESDEEDRAVVAAAARKRTDQAVN